ncbi:Hypothetical predicted protein, partial [Olea europaea subsp. europaea]
VQLRDGAVPIAASSDVLAEIMWNCWVVIVEEVKSFPLMSTFSDFSGWKVAENDRLMTTGR